MTEISFEEMRRIQARNRLYPGWRSATIREREEGQMKPFYLVICHSIVDFELAKEVKPPGIEARIVLAEPQK